MKFIITCTHIRKLEALLGIGILKSSGNIKTGLEQLDCTLLYMQMHAEG